MPSIPDTKAFPLALIAVADPAVRRLCSETLGDAGFCVAKPIESGAAAVTTAREWHPDVIILSQQLSDVPASEAIRWLRSNQLSAETPIIILGNDAANAPTDPRLTVLPRPITPDRLRVALIQTLAEAGRRDH